jgi:ribosomal protein S18 acetylase RimI-like enzyme
VYEKEGKVLGYVSFQFNAGKICIEEIAVDSSHRKKGIMTDLIQEVESVNPGMGLVLNVAESNNPAYHAFLRYGFKDTGMTNGQYRMMSKD